MEDYYSENLKEQLFLYKFNPEKRDELYDVIMLRNKNKLFRSMLEMFEEDVDNFKYDSNTNILYIFALLDLIPDVIGNNKYLQQTCSYKFTEIHGKLKDIIHSKPENLNKEETGNYKTIKNILSKLENTIIKLEWDIPQDYDPNKEEFISYIIFNSKNLNILENSVKQFPHIVNTRDEQETPLLFKVLDKYIESLNIYASNPNLGPIDDLIYYKKVIKILLSSEKLSINDEDKKNILIKLQNELKNFKYDVTRQKEKYTYFINSVLMMILGEEETNTISNLNYEYEVHEDFKATHNLEAKRIYILNKNIVQPKQKRHIYSFDGEDAKELDDALSIIHEDGIYHLGVHIANPYKYIGNKSILYDEARKRTRSLYFNNDCIPMYPINLSGDLMSLNEGETRYAMNHLFDIDDRTGELISYKITDDPIKVTKNCTYKQFNEDIQKGSDDEDYYETLLELCDVAPILGRVYDEETTYKEFHNDNAQTLSTSVVEKCMIYTNYQLAKLFSDKGLPYIYRCHMIDPETTKKIEDMTERMRLRDPNNQNKEYIKNLELIKGIFPRAYYTNKNVGHMGLGTTYYSHVTSPLRRYADNIASECIYKFILGEYTEDDIKAYNEYIQMISEEINAKRRTLDSYEIERMHIK